MTAKVGTNPFTTKESASSEDRSRRIFNQILSESKYAAFSIEKSYSMNDVYDTDKSVTHRRGHDAVTEPDLGLLKLNGKPVGLGDNKYQTALQNAVERVCLYTLDAMRMGISPKNVLIVFDGPAFNKNSAGKYTSAPGKQLVRSMYHNTCFVQPTDQELDTGIREYLDRILEENT